MYPIRLDLGLHPLTEGSTVTKTFSRVVKMCECEAEEANESGHVIESGVNELKHYAVHLGALLLLCKHFAVRVHLLLCNDSMWTMHAEYAYISRQEL